MRQQISTLWHRLIAVHGSLPEMEQRRARMLAACLFASSALVLVLAVPLIIASSTAAGGWLNDPQFWLTAVTGGLLLFAYLLNRRGRFQAAAGLTVLVGTASAWVGVLYNFTVTNANYDSLVPAYLTGAILLSSLLVRLRATVMLALIQIIGLALLPLLIPAIPLLAVADVLIFTSIMSTLIIVSANIRDQDSSRLQQQAAALAESEARYRSVIKALGEGIILRDRSLGVLAANGAAERLLGVNSAQLRAMTSLEEYWHVIHEDGSPFPAATHPAAVAMQTGQSFTNVIMGLEAPGKRLTWLSVNSQPITREGEAKPYAVVTSFSDITARKQAEDALRDSEGRLQSILDNSPAVIYLKDRSGCYLLTNRRYEGLFGLQRGQLIGKRTTDYFSSAEATRYGEQDQTVIETGEPLEVEEVAGPIGQTRTYISVKFPLRDADGVVYAVCSISTDISERKQAEEALAAERDLLQALMDNVPDSIYFKDTNSRLTRFNRSFMKLLGIGSTAEAVGKSDFDLQSPELASEFYAEEQQLINSGIPITDRIEYNPFSDGRPRWLSASKSPLLDKDGQIVGLVGISRDVTERKQTQEVMERSLSLVQATLESIAEGILVVDADGMITNYNRRFIEMWRIPQSVLPLRQVAQLAPYAASQVAGGDAFGVNLTANGEKSPAAMQNLLEFKDGRVFERSVRLQQINDSTIGTVLSFHDISERQQSARALTEANAKLTAGLNELEQRTVEMAALNEMSDFLQACSNFDEAYTVISRSAGRLFPGTSGLLFVVNASRNLVEPVARWGVTLADTPAFRTHDCWALRRGRTHHVGSPANALPPGHPAHVPDLFCDHVRPPLPSEYLCIPLVAHGETLGILHLQRPATGAAGAERVLPQAKQQLARTVADSVAQSLANLHLQETLRNQSIRDPLTNLFNRRYLEETLDRELHRAARDHSALSIIIMDIDQFKQFNDSYGHDAGDLLLHELGIFLQANIRAGDIACRLGGEEFTLVLPETPVEVAMQRAESLRESVKKLRVEHLGQPLGLITLSLGVSTFPQHGGRGEQLMRIADGALYRAKHEGRDRVAVAS